MAVAAAAAVAEAVTVTVVASACRICTRQEKQGNPILWYDGTLASRYLPLCATDREDKTFHRATYFLNRNQYFLMPDVGKPQDLGVVVGQLAIFYFSAEPAAGAEGVSKSPRRGSPRSINRPPTK
ncbi:MAG: hypothetical protein H0T82_09200 [Sphingomonas sp.]|nr:hypothetical protein [Sphingomonas sp.]